MWQADPELGLSQPEDIGLIPPNGTVTQGRGISYLDARDNTFLTFRDAAGARWIRMPDGTLKEQDLPTARESLLATLGQPPPAAAPQPPATPGQDADPEQP